MIEVHGLCKDFRDSNGQWQKAVDHVSFSVKAGEIFGLLGPNGAGKSTTLRMLCTVLKPTSGTANVAGFDTQTHSTEVRANIGFLSAGTGVYDRMSALEMVEYFGKLHGLTGDKLQARIEEVFNLLQMQSFRDKPGSQLSTGMRQKVSIARALIHDPPVLIFDEPTIGLDVLVQRSVLQAIASLKQLGKAILFSTHIMREVEKLCDRVAIMHQGRILETGTLQSVREKYHQADLEEIFFQLVAPNEPPLVELVNP
jgi:sodium transport system ATP-binding protein